MIVFGEFDWHIVVVFCVLRYSIWRPKWQQQQSGESHSFCYDTLHGKNNRLMLFVMLFLSLLWLLYSLIYTPLPRPFLARSDNTIISQFVPWENTLSKRSRDKCQGTLNGRYNLKRCCWYEHRDITAGLRQVL